MTQVATPVESTPTKQVGLDQILAKSVETKSLGEATPPNGGSPDGHEEKAPAASEQPNKETKEEKTQSADGQTAKEEPKDPRIEKLEKSGYRSREKNRQLQTELAAMKKDLAEAKTQMGLAEPQAEPTEEQKKSAIQQNERLTISRKQFIKNHSEKELNEKIAGEDSSWMEIEQSAGDGDAHAINLHQRVMRADDPFEEALVVLEEEALFQEHGTRSVVTLLEKVRAKDRETLKQEILNELKGSKGGPTGKPVKTLGSANGENGLETKAAFTTPSLGQVLSSLR